VDLWLTATALGREKDDERAGRGPRRTW
jgi:hypothetical protein